MRTVLLPLFLGSAIFAHAQNLPTISAPELSKEQTHALQSSIKAADKATENYQSTQAWEKIEQELTPRAWQRKQATIQRQLDSMFQPAPGSKKKDNEDGPRLVSNQLVLFVSSSMPLHTLRAYARDLAKVGGVMVLRGGVGGLRQIQPTLQLSQSVLSVKAGCEGQCKMWDTEVLIDPMLFRMYGITKVPALIYQPDMKISAYCDGLDKAQKGTGVVYGDASLMAMIDELYKENNTPILKAVSQQLWSKQ